MIFPAAQPMGVIGTMGAVFVPAQQLFGRFKSRVIQTTLYPLLQRHRHPFAHHYLQELRRHEFASLEVVEKFQWEKLKNLLEYAADRIPYYRNLMRKEGIEPARVLSFTDFARFPILNKPIIREHSSEFLPENHDPGQLQPNASGGSTGKPLQFYQDQKYWDYAAAIQMFVESWWGIRPGDPTASIWGTDLDLPPRGWKERISSGISQFRVCNAFALTSDRMEGFARMLSSWQPRFIIGYASALYLFARFVLERPYLSIRPHAVKSTAEVLTDNERAIVEEAFRCPVYNFYGSREVNNLAAECPAHKGLHVNALTRYIEVVDETGKPLGPLQPGRILVTDLTNYAMPFIRYEIEDIGIWSAAPCTCGRPFPALANVLGRKSDFILTPAGKLIHGEYFTHMFYGMPEVTQFQLVQDSLDHVRMEVVLNPGASESSVASVRSRLSESMGAGVRCDVVIVQHIERPRSGKHRFTVSSVPIPWGHVDQKLDSSSPSA
jgi:phenylacetate-CoA ligase